MDLKIKKTVQHVPILLIVFGVLLIIISGIASVRIAQQYHRGPRFAPRQTNVSSIQPWMTLSYISRVYGVPESEFDKEFGIAPGTYHHATLKQLAAALKKNDVIFVKEVKSYITKFQLSHLEPPK